ncbi:MAG: TIM barrel protein [Clostridia bacterium]|nr:TIM barrel protein [Clostridia bacterium]
MKIYPKTSRNFEGLDKLMPYVEKSKGIELQFFDENGIIAEFEIESVIDELIKRVQDIKEVTIHPPLCDYDLELILFKDATILEKQLRLIVKLTQKYGIRINLLYHTQWRFEKHKELTLGKLRELLKIIEGENVIFLLENLYMFDEKECTVFQIAEYLDHPNLKVCFDICHMYCRNNIRKSNIEEYAATYLNPELCKKYIYQVHFSYTVDNDGYILKKTHGRGHRNIEDLKYDFDLMKKYNMTECNYITEVSEDNYDLRVDQLKELEMLHEVANGEK